MSYQIKTIESTAKILAADLDDAYEALCLLNKRHDKKSGFTTNGRAIKTTHFAFMPADYPDRYKSAFEIFQALGFESELIINSGNLIIGHYNDPAGDEKHFLEAVAPYIVDGGFITWEGQNLDDYWRWDFENGYMTDSRGRLSWDWVA